LERCLACEAVGTRGDREIVSLPGLRSVIRPIETRTKFEGLILGTCADAAIRLNRRDKSHRAERPASRYHLVHHAASQARQRSRAFALFLDQLKITEIKRGLIDRETADRDSGCGRLFLHVKFDRTINRLFRDLEECTSGDRSLVFVGLL
jgi:hypothetical protein